MAVYVDEIRTYSAERTKGLGHTRWSHMTADTVEELHQMAERIGLKRSWFQEGAGRRVGWHYDVTPNKRAAAIKLGAKEVNFRFMAELMEKRRIERDYPCICATGSPDNYEGPNEDCPQHGRCEYADNGSRCTFSALPVHQFHNCPPVPDERDRRCGGCGEPLDNGQPHGLNQGYGGCV